MNGKDLSVLQRRVASIIANCRKSDLHSFSAVCKKGKVFVDIDFAGGVVVEFKTSKRENNKLWVYEGSTPYNEVFTEVVLKICSLGIDVDTIEM